MRKFKQFLYESKDMLDISILPLNKVLSNDSKIKDFLTSNIEVTAKTDGVKITALKISNSGSINDWIIAYKNNILFDGEFNFTTKTHINTTSFGAAQFKIVIDHFKNLGKVNIPNGEYFIEFLMRKPTLSSNYEKSHKMILIGYSKSTYTINGGKLITKPSGFNTEKREEYASLLKIMSPLLLFKGQLASPLLIEKGIKYNPLMDTYNTHKTAINWNDNNSIILNFTSSILEVPSLFGGKEEGAVITWGDNIAKIQQSYQTDQKARAEIKQKFQASPEEETQYWNNVRLKAFEIMNNVKVNSLEKTLSDVSLILKSTKINFSHPIKTADSIKEDIQLTLKNLIIRKLKGNNGALFVGKMRVLTKLHYKIIKDGIKKYDTMNVVLVTSSDTKSTRDLRMKMLKTAFGDSIEIQESTSGNLLTLLNKFHNNINVVLAGTDRVQSYKNQLVKNPDVQVVEIPRTDEGISATKVIENIQDEVYFKKNTPTEIHSLYPQILKTYKEVSNQN